MQASISARHSEATRQVMPLAFLKRGDSGVVNAVHLGDDVRKKLITLGICQNSEVKVCSESCGSVIVSVGNAHYALSRATAMRIMVGICGENGVKADAGSGSAATTDITDAAEIQSISNIANLTNIGAGNGLHDQLHDLKKAVGTI